MVRLAAALSILLLSASWTAGAQAPRPLDPAKLVEEVARYQIAYLQHRDASLQYEAHRIDSKEDVTRAIVESSDGPIGRTIARNGRPLTPQEDTAERARLQALSAASLEKKQKGEQSGEKFGTELITAMPSAMIYTLTPGQPQLPGLLRHQIVLDFSPNPAFHPVTTAQNILTGLQGRLWVDAADHHLIRMELHVIHNLNLAWGLLARVYSGGTLEYDQRDVGGGHYAYTRITMDLTLRELMVRTVPYRSLIEAYHHHVMPAMPSQADAVRILLSYPVAAAAPAGR